jgi:hypothetical protein
MEGEFEWSLSGGFGEFPFWKRIKLTEDGISSFLSFASADNIDLSLNNS